MGLIFAPPAPDQIEISVYGPGYGECSLVHIGGGEWVVIDSCIDTKSGRPIALEYLKLLGLNPAKCVKFIIATHWHDDHVRGISELVKSCSNAKFCASSALSAPEFLTIARLYTDRSLLSGSSGLSEMFSVFEGLKKEKRNPVRAISDRRIVNYAPHETVHGLGCEIWTLSPSDAQVALFFKDLAKLMPHNLDAKVRAPSRNPNHLSIVTWIKFGDIAILLGGDLETTREPSCGWAPIVVSKERPQGKARIFKIPHHGSENGHMDEVWTDMIRSDCLAVLTPYLRGRKHLPSAADVTRIVARAPNSFSTSALKVSAARRRVREVEKQIKARTQFFGAAEGNTGGIRFRNSGQADPDKWNVEMWNSAMPLQNLRR